MHDPMTVAFEIKSPFFHRFQGMRFHNSIVTVWHCDPERDGTDDSCGWFQRSRHGDKAVLSKIVSGFDFDWDKWAGSWFKPDGTPNLSTIAITFGMMHKAAWEHFKHNRRKTDRFMRRHAADLISFAENPTDSLFQSINRVYGVNERETREDRIASFASVCYGWVLRATRPWYRHPKWHVHHWKIQVHAIQQLKRRLFTRCAGCGKSFNRRQSVHTAQWHAKGPQWFKGEQGVYHEACMPVPTPCTPPAREPVPTGVN
jgi:hypothetical protein